MENRIKDVLSRTIIYSGLNLITHDRFDHEEGIPIFLTGQILYTFIDDKDIITGQEYIFQVLWQIFIDSMIVEKKSTIFFDALMCAGALAIRKNILKF